MSNTSDVIVARTLCKISNWELGVVRMHRILYFAHRELLGETGRKLVTGTFRRWPYGPVLTEVHEVIKNAGRNKIEESMFGLYKTLDEDSERYKFLYEEYEKRKEQRATQLVDESRIPGGAWHKCFEQGMKKIPHQFILQEYNDILDGLE